MNLCLFFEGTGQGVAGEYTNVTRLYEMAIKDDHQKCHIESGPGTRIGSYVSGTFTGVDWRRIFKSSRRWFEANYKTLPPDSSTTEIFIFGFSRGALIARHFAQWLDKLGIIVRYLGLWDTVDSTLGLDVKETLPENVSKARHAVARDEKRKFFSYVPLKSGKYNTATELLFPGSHSDVGGLYEDDHQVADVALAWIAEGARKGSMRLKSGIKCLQKLNKKTAKLHDSHKMANNLWGFFDKATRRVAGLRLHWNCYGVKNYE